MELLWLLRRVSFASAEIIAPVSAYEQLATGERTMIKAVV
jgi:hypothetical protein